MTRPAIFLIEDDVTTIQNLSLTLKKAGYTVAGSALSGEEALAAIPTLQPDLVLIDIDLRRGEGCLDGTQTARQLQAIYPVPVIFLTAQDDPATLRRTLQTEAEAFIFKPFNETELIFTIDKTLSRAVKGVGQGQANPALKEFLLVKKGNQYTKVKISDILFVQAEKMYLSIHTVGGEEYVASIPLAQFERNYDFPDLIRISRSHFVNIRHSDSYEEPSTLMVAGKAFILGKTYRKVIKDLLPFLRTC